MKIEVGQVWKLDGDLMMISSVNSKEGIRAGSAKKRGSSYVIIGTPKRIDQSDVLRGEFVFDTES
jgi:hypothetical protein